MPAPILFAVIVVAVAVFVLAAFFVGREARRLDAIAPRVVYELEEAVVYVADRLPTDSQTQLTYDEVRDLLRAHLRWLHGKGLQPRRVSDRRQDLADPVVVEDTTAVGFLIAAAAQIEIEVDDLDLARVTEAHLAYLDEIGAIGPEAADPDVDPLAIERGFRSLELPPANGDDAADR